MEKILFFPDILFPPIGLHNMHVVRIQIISNKNPCKKTNSCLRRNLPRSFLSASGWDPFPRKHFTKRNVSHFPISSFFAPISLCTQKFSLTLWRNRNPSSSSSFSSANTLELPKNSEEKQGRRKVTGVSVGIIFVLFNFVTKRYRAKLSAFATIQRKEMCQISRDGSCKVVKYSF